MARNTARLDAFSGWLIALGDAWESGDSDAAAALFTVAATLQPSPFETVIRGRRSIETYLADKFASIPGASFAAQLLGAGDTYGIAHFRIGSPDEALDGVLVVALDDRGRCRSLRQWWHESGSDRTKR